VKEHPSPDRPDSVGPRVLLVVNAAVEPESEALIAQGLSPRKDYLELQRNLGADILDLGALERRAVSRLARRILGAAAAQALHAWLLAPRYDVIFVDRETSGFLLGALLQLPRGRTRSGTRRRRPRLVVIAHILSTTKKQIMGRVTRAARAIDHLVVHSTGQQEVALDRFGFTRQQVVMVPYQTDDTFWAPADASPCNQICSVGLEFRDYETLLKAVDGLDVDVVIGAASYWSRHRSIGADARHPRLLPPRVHVDSFDYVPLRDLYARSLLVVVPLFDVDNQAGITVILEAMAMGKALIVTRTRGQADVVRDRRHASRSDPDRLTQPDWVRKLGASAEIAEGQTGFYVTPGDVVELRRAIVFLLEHPDYARELGMNGRKVIEETMSLDHFTQRLSALIRGESQPAAPAVGSSRSDSEPPTRLSTGR